MTNIHTSGQSNWYSEKQGHNAFYVSLLGKASGWSRYKDNLIKEMEDQSDKIIATDEFYDRVSFYYPKVCRIVSFTIRKRIRPREKLYSIPREEMLNDILAISFVELMDIFEEGLTNEVKNCAGYLYRKLYLQTIRSVLNFYGIRDRLNFSGRLVSFDFSEPQGDEEEDSSRHNSMMRNHSESLCVPFEAHQEKAYDKADRWYHIKTGRRLSLLELDHFAELLDQDTGIFFTQREKESVLSAIEDIKEHLKVRNSKVYNLHGVLSHHVRMAVNSGLKNKKDIAKYLDDKNILYDRRSLARTVAQACEAKGIKPPKETISESRQVNHIVYDCVDKGMSNQEIYAHLENGGYLTPRIMNSKTPIGQRIRHSRFRYLKRKAKIKH